MNIIKTNLQYKKPLIPLDLNNVNYIIIHHPDIKTATVEEIHQWHLDNGWDGFGYNEYIRKDGTVYIGRGDTIGAQCQGYNSKSYGICCEGNYDIETEMPEVQKQALVKRIKYHKQRLPNVKLVAPHKQFCDTSCPGKNFPLAEILKRVEVIDVEIKTVDEAMNILKDKGLMNSPEYWEKVVDTVKNFDQFLINIANFAQKQT